jgi:hypothetical protein
MIIKLLKYGLGSCVIMVAALGAVAKAQGTWTTKASMQVARHALAAARGLDGRIYAFGGSDAVSVLSAVEVYDPPLNTWSPRAPMPTARNSVAAVTANNGLIYVIGGFNGNILTTVEAYNPATNTWTPKRSMLQSRSYPGATLGSDGRIYVCGGATSVSLNSAEVYDPATDMWSPLPNMNISRYSPGMGTAYDGKIFVYGGSQATVEVYNGISWSLASPMTTARSVGAYTRGPDGRLYAIGGANDAIGVLSAAEVLPSSEGTWSSLPSMPTRRGWVTAATGSDGTVYVIGGFDGTNYLRTVEAYRPVVTGSTDHPYLIVSILNTNRFPDGSIGVSISVRNIGGKEAFSTVLAGADLRPSLLSPQVIYASSPLLPASLSTITSGGQSLVNLVFPPGLGAAGTPVLLEVGGAYFDPLLPYGIIRFGGTFRMTLP